MIGHDLLLAVASLCQGFYCYRIGVFTKSKYAVVLISTVREFPQSRQCSSQYMPMIQLSLCQLSASVASAIQVKRAVLITKLYESDIPFITIGVRLIYICKHTVRVHKLFDSQIWGISGFACDVVIAVFMTYHVSPFIMRTYDANSIFGSVEKTRNLVRGNSRYHKKINQAVH